MNLKKLGALSIGAIIIGVLVLAGSASAADEEWSGSATGTIYHGGVEYHPWATWDMDFTIYNASLYSVTGQWVDGSGHTGRIWGYVSRSTGQGSGYWGIDNTVPYYTGTWSGNFNYTTETCVGEWTCSAGDGDWTGVRDYP